MWPLGTFLSKAFCYYLHLRGAMRTIDEPNGVRIDGHAYAQTQTTAQTNAQTSLALPNNYSSVNL